MAQSEFPFEWSYRFSSIKSMSKTDSNPYDSVVVETIRQQIPSVRVNNSWRIFKIFLLFQFVIYMGSIIWLRSVTHSMEKLSVVDLLSTPYSFAMFVLQLTDQTSKFATLAVVSAAILLLCWICRASSFGTVLLVAIALLTYSAMQGLVLLVIAHGMNGI